MEKPTSIHHRGSLCWMKPKTGGSWWFLRPLWHQQHQWLLKPQNPPQGTPTHPVNSWTNLQIRDAQTVLATQARSSPTRVWAEEIEATNPCIDWVNDTMQTLRGNLSTIGLRMPERDTVNQPGTSVAAEPPVDPVNNPIGTQLQMIPKALYAHIPMAMQRTMMVGAFTNFRNLLLDPLVLLRANKHVLSHNPDTSVAKWVETNTVKDIPNFDTWVKAYCTYMAIYLMANPDRALEMVKYEHVIHDASLRYDWRSVLLYDITFHQAQSEEPGCSWGVMDTELYAECFTGRVLPRLPMGDKTRVQKACYPFNQGKCTWKNCCYLHKYSKCGRMGHPAVKCRQGNTGGQPDQQGWICL